MHDLPTQMPLLWMQVQVNAGPSFMIDTHSIHRHDVRVMTYTHSLVIQFQAVQYTHTHTASIHMTTQPWHTDTAYAWPSDSDATPLNAGPSFKIDTHSIHMHDVRVMTYTHSLVIQFQPYNTHTHRMHIAYTCVICVRVCATTNMTHMEHETETQKLKNTHRWT